MNKSKDIRIVFMGTPEFAVASLNALVKNNFNVVAVVTAADKPSGRGQLLNQSAVKQFAIKNGLYLLQPENLKDAAFQNELRQLNADLQIVVAFRMLPEAIWSMPKEGTFNLHASLLPKYRGAAPINWAIINGDNESGVTTFKLKHEIDTGSILFQEKVKIGTTDTAADLHDKLMNLGSNLVVRTVESIAKKMFGTEQLFFREQEDSMSSHAPKIYKHHCRINWNKPAIDIYNLIRGLSPYPGAYAEFTNQGVSTKIIKIFFAEYTIAYHEKPVGTIDSDHQTYLKVFCADGFLSIKDLQAEGKKRMLVSEFLRGFKLTSQSRMIE
jgi:methionyl-tRNA formyltransferase